MITASMLMSPLPRTLPIKGNPTHSKKGGDKGGNGNHFYHFCDMVEKTLSLRRGNWCSWNRSFSYKIY